MNTGKWEQKNQCAFCGERNKHYTQFSLILVPLFFIYLGICLLFSEDRITENGENALIYDSIFLDSELGSMYLS